MPAKSKKAAAAPAAAETRLKPLGDHVVIKPIPREERTKSGIYLPDTAKEKPQEGTVLAVGPGRQTDEGTYIPMALQVGDRVLYSKWAGTDFKQDDVELLIVGEKDILCIIT